MRARMAFVGIAACLCGFVLALAAALRNIESPLTKATKAEAVFKQGGDDFILVEHVCPDLRIYNNYSIIIDKATGARVLCVYGSGGFVSTCLLPPLPAALLEVKKP